MAGMDKLKNVVREPNVVELKAWKSIHYEIKEPMVTDWEQLKSRNLPWRWVSPHHRAGMHGLANSPTSLRPVVYLIVIVTISAN